MVKVTVLLPKPQDATGFEEYYFQHHVPLIMNLPYVKDIEIVRSFDVQNMNVQPHFIAQFSYENKQVMEKSLQSVEGKALHEDVANLMKFLPHPPMIIFGEFIN